MPWLVEKTGEEWCVYKEGSGGKPTGDALGCHESKSAAEKQMRALYAAVQEFGGSLNDFIEKVRSAFSRQFPGVSSPDGTYSYAWPTDVFEDHVIARQGDQYYQVSMKQKKDEIEFAKADKWKPVQLSYVLEMLQEHVQDFLAVFEIQNTGPEVPLSEGVDSKALTEGDTDPVFLTLPIGKANVKSGNKRYYDQSFVQELEKQVVSLKPIGLMGHLSSAQRVNEFPEEAVHWVGAKLDGDILWGKGYIPPGNARSRIKRYKASGRKIATSIDAFIDGKWDADISAYRMDASTMKLNQIDIAPADRAGIPDLAAVPLITQEMVQLPKEGNVDREEVVKSLTVADIAALPAAIVQAIQATVAPPPEDKVVTEMRQVLGLGDSADILEHLKGLQKKEQDRHAQEVQSRIVELVQDPEKGIKLEPVRPLVVQLVQSRNPATVQEAEAAFQEVIGTEAVKEMLKITVQGLSGPKINDQVQGKVDAPKYFQVPQG